MQHHSTTSLTEVAVPERRRTLRWLSAGGVAASMGMGLLAFGNAASGADTTDTDTINTVLNYAETQYATWFPGSQSNRSSGLLTYRYYPTTGNYIGVSGGRLYVYGPVSGNQVVDVGAVTAFASAAASGSSATPGSGTCSIIPEETEGPYPGDGSNGLNNATPPNGGQPPTGAGAPGNPPTASTTTTTSSTTNTSSSGTINALSLSGIVRRDIRSSVGGATGVAQGIPLTVKLKLVNTGASCASLANYAIYIWHCTRDGLYSLYSTGVTGENFLRGVQATDSDGVATFTTIFPGCYLGRMPHIHFEVFRSVSTATSATGKIKTSQMAFPIAICNQVYTAEGYSSSASNFKKISFATDNVFSDGTSLQMVSITGDNTNGYVATLQVGIAI